MGKAWNGGVSAFNIMLNQIAIYHWWRHDIGLLSALLAFCQGNPPVTSGFPLWRASDASFLCCGCAEQPVESPVICDVTVMATLSYLPLWRSPRCRHHSRWWPVCRCPPWSWCYSWSAGSSARFQDKGSGRDVRHCAPSQRSLLTRTTRDDDGDATCGKLCKAS